MSAKKILTITTDHEELRRVEATVKEFGEAENWSAVLINQITLVLEELGLNIMDYGHDSRTHEIEIELSSNVDTLGIKLTDDGRPFNILEDSTPPDLDSPVEERPVGGLGVALVLAIMDEVHYKREQDTNCLTLTKRRNE